MIQSVVKAIKIMNLFSTTDPHLSLAEISKRLNMPKSTAHNLLSTLLSEGLIEKVNNDQYALGRAVIALTQNVLVNVELRDRAAPLLRQLADSCDESVYLSIRDGNYMLYIYAIESSQRLLARSAVGDRAMMHCTGLGKAILAYLPQEDVLSITGEAGMPRFTENTFDEITALQAELSKTRQRGYSLDHQEHELNTYCVAGPIFNAAGQIIGACSVSGADPEIINGRVKIIANEVMHTAQEISRRMGYVPATPSLVSYGNQ